MLHDCETCSIYTAQQMQRESARGGKTKLMKYIQNSTNSGSRAIVIGFIGRVLPVTNSRPHYSRNHRLVTEFVSAANVCTVHRTAGTQCTVTTSFHSYSFYFGRFWHPIRMLTHTEENFKWQSIIGQDRFQGQSTIRLLFGEMLAALKCLVGHISQFSVAVSRIRGTVFHLVAGFRGHMLLHWILNPNVELRL